MIKNYIKDYPRPQFLRNKWFNLNGEWNFIFDDNNIGEKEQYYMSFPNSIKINVPFTYETEFSGINDQSVHNVIWYNKEINIAKALAQNKKVILHFEGSDYITKVWINGKYIGKNVGGYTRFSFEIENYLIDGNNNITVKVEDSLSKSQPRGKQRYKNESWECWYIQTTGIWKTVWLEIVNDNYIESVKNTPDYDCKKISLEIATNISEEEFLNNEYIFEAQISFNNTIVKTQKVEFLQNNQKLEIYIDDNDNPVYFWSVEKPNLYDMEYKLYKNNKLIDNVFSYFGIRKIEIRNNKIFLNDKELYQKLILDQGYWGKSHLTPPNEEALLNDICNVIKFGYNGIRKHQKIEDERFLLWCDIKGILVWSEFPACYEFNDESIKEFTNQWIKAVNQNYNHPSIIVWVPINESWGVPEVRNNIRQQNFVNSIYYLTKAMDITRLVITNDGWEHTISDIVTIHDYKQDSKELGNLYINNKNKIIEKNEQLKNKHSLFSENYKYNGQPIIMSEYGGIALISSEGWGYGQAAKNSKDFIERFSNLTNTLKNIDYLSGYCYTQLSDVQQEKNGLLDEDRKTKFNEDINNEINKINK